MNLKHAASMIGAFLLPLTANAGLAENAGFSGEVSVLAGIISTDSNLSTSGNSTKTGTLNSNAERESETIAGPLGRIAYTFGDNLDKQFFAGMSREDIAVGTFALEMGYRQELESGTKVAVSFLPTVLSEDIWRDPFITGSARQETEKSGNAFRLQLDSIAGRPLSVDMAYATSDIEDEKSGASLLASPSDRAALQRGGNTFYTKVNYRNMLNRTSGLTPSLIYINNAADGDAMAFSSLGGELSWFQAYNKHFFAVTLHYAHRSYDSTHPIFDTARSDDEFGAFFAYQFKQLLGYQNLGLVSLAGFSTSESNIEFYDESEYLATVGVTYKF